MQLTGRHHHVTCRSHHAGECSVHDWFKYLTAVGTNDLRYQLPEKVEYNPMYFFLGDKKKTTHTHTRLFNLLM